MDNEVENKGEKFGDLKTGAAFVGCRLLFLQVHLLQAPNSPAVPKSARKLENLEFSTSNSSKSLQKARKNHPFFQRIARLETYSADLQTRLTQTWGQSFESFGKIVMSNCRLKLKEFLIIGEYIKNRKNIEQISYRSKS